MATEVRDVPGRTRYEITFDAQRVDGSDFFVGFTFRLLALYRGWEEPLAREPQGVYVHSDGRPLLGRKLAGKSQRELRDLGLLAMRADARALANADLAPRLEALTASYDGERSLRAYAAVDRALGRRGEAAVQLSGLTAPDSSNGS